MVGLGILVCYSLFLIACMMVPILSITCDHVVCHWSVPRSFAQSSVNVMALCSTCFSCVVELLSLNFSTSN